MKVDALIKKLTALRKKHGNVDVLVTADGNGPYWIYEPPSFEVVEEGDYPEHYNMKPGYKWIRINS